MIKFRDQRFPLFLGKLTIDDVRRGGGEIKQGLTISVAESLARTVVGDAQQAQNGPGLGSQQRDDGEKARAIGRIGPAARSRVAPKIVGKEGVARSRMALGERHRQRPIAAIHADGGLQHQRAVFELSHCRHAGVGEPGRKPDDGRQMRRISVA